METETLRAKPKSAGNKAKTSTKEASKETTQKKILEGGAFIKHVLKKGGKSQGPLLIEDLDEKELQQRLILLKKELQEYKNRVERYKRDNQWYRDEIETSQRDTEEYIMYLESKKNEKLEAVHKLAESNKKDIDRFMQMKQKHELVNNQKLAELKDCIVELEEKLNRKEDEFLQLSDTIAKRAKHYDEMSKIKNDIKIAEVQHQEQVLELEKSLLDTRLKLQKDSDDRIKMMESDAEQKAAKYLADHTFTIQRENRQLQQQLTKLTLQTSRLMERKDQLVNENKELGRQQKISMDLIKLRLSQVQKAEEREYQRKMQRQAGISKARQQFMSHLSELKGKHTDMDIDILEKQAVGDWYDYDSEDD